ncbi:MAG: heparan-alpha-glucosaminide N-acetyltransferase domain-containing protein [Pirellulales bacterium]
MSEKPATPRRIVSMDQFRGYTVAGMFVVNFLAGLQATPKLLIHHNTYFSYADSIFPGFLFAVGFSYRLTALRRIPRDGARQAFTHYFQRGMALVLLSIVMYGFGTGFSDWQKFDSQAVRHFFAVMFKANLWEVLAIIGVTQIFIFPVIAAGISTRVLAMIACLVAHPVLSYAFNFDMVYGRANVVDALLGTSGMRAWDGGPLGIVSWSVVMLAGTIAYDIVAHRPPADAIRQLLMWGTLLMAIGYAASCLTRLYDVPPGERADDRLAASPVWPPWQRAVGKSLLELFSEPPLVAPPPPTVRQENYWMMGKRVVSASFVLFASGFSLALYALFVALCDIWSLRVGLLRTFGENPLAAYVIHYMVETSIRPLVPNNSPAWYALLGFTVFFGITYLLVRHLEKHKIYLRL